MRHKECPAYGTVCGHCNKDHHFESVCRGKAKTKISRSSEQESAVFDVLCELTMQCNMSSISLDHVYDWLMDKWLKCPSKSQPFVRLSMTVQKEEYKHFGFCLSVQLDAVLVNAMADMGCQSCLAGFELIEKLGLSNKDLISVNMRMHSADNCDIPILGAIILRLSGRDQLSNERMTRQIVYITYSTDKLFLSREACVDLGIIPVQFPIVGVVPAQADYPTPPSRGCASFSQDVVLLDYNFPRRSKPPPLPTSLPCTANEANVSKLKQYFYWTIIVSALLIHVNIKPCP